MLHSGLADRARGSAGASSVTGDELRLRQAVGNLLSNARSHTPAGTHIAVRVAARRAGHAWRCPTPVRASRPTSPATCSSASSGPMRRAPGRPAAPGSGCRSWRRSPRRTAAGPSWSRASEHGTTFRIVLPLAARRRPGLRSHGHVDRPVGQARRTSPTTCAGRCLTRRCGWRQRGIGILKLNIGNPAPFGFEAPEDRAART